jgi:hypothetical protein
MKIRRKSKKPLIPQKWSDMEQEEKTHSIRIDGIKLRNLLRQSRKGKYVQAMVTSRHYSHRTMTTETAHHAQHTRIEKK